MSPHNHNIETTMKKFNENGNFFSLFQNKNINFVAQDQIGEIAINFN